jgi:heat shock protein 1/8
MKYLPFQVIAKEGDKAYVRVLDNGVEIDFSPVVLCAMVLKNMKEIAGAFVGKPAYISIPTSFTYRQRQAIKEAGTIAGLNVLQLIHGSSAVVDFTRRFRLWPPRADCVLVFDMGGGSLSVSLVVVESDGLKVKVRGNNHLGGVDFDNRMVAHFVDEFKKKFGKDISGNSHAINRLQKACEAAKTILSSFSEAPIILESFFEGHDFHTTITKVYLSPSSLLLLYFL